MERPDVGIAADRATIGRRPARALWLVLATDGPGLALAADPAVDVRLVASPARFSEALRSDQPALAVLTCPPADPPTMELAARERRRRGRLRIVLLDQPDAVAERVTALEHGFDDALPVTVEASELLARLRWLVRRPGARDRDAIALGSGLELDLSAHQLRRDGQPVHLRPKEYQLLELLARYPGRAFTRQQLLDRVWGRGRHGDPRTVDVHVRWLRSKVEETPERPVRLITVRGMGYRLDPER